MREKVGGLKGWFLVVLFSGGLSGLRAQYYKPVEVAGSLEGRYVAMHVEDLWRVRFRGLAVGGRILFRLEVYVYDSEGGLLYRGSSFALYQTEEVWDVDFAELSTFGMVRQEGVDSRWWRLVSDRGGYLPSGSYRVEYVVVETDERCVWTGVELARGSVYFEVFSGYVVVPLYPGEGDTVCGAVSFGWGLVGWGGDAYEVLVYQGRLTLQEVLQLQPVLRSGLIEGFEWVPLGSVLANAEGWFTYVVRSEEGVYSELVSFYHVVDCSEGVKEGSGRFETVWWQQLGLVDGVQEFVLRGDTLFLEWIQECSVPARFRYGGRGLEVLARWEEGAWMRLVALVRVSRLAVQVEVCGKVFRQEWLLRGGLEKSGE